MSPAPDQSFEDPSTDASASAKVVRPAELLEGLLEPVVSSMGYELVHTEFSGSGKHRRLVARRRPPTAARQTHPVQLVGCLPRRWPRRD